MLTPHPPTNKSFKSSSSYNFRQRNSRLFDSAIQHNDEMDSEYQSLNQLHAEGRSGRRLNGKNRSSHLPKVASYLRESQPKTKYITDPAALTLGQDLQSAAFLVKELDQGRVERLRRFQPKARNRKRRNRKKRGRGVKKHRKTIKKIPEWLNGIYLGNVDDCKTTDDNNQNGTTKEEDDEIKLMRGPNTIWNRLKEDPHAQPGENMNFINKPSSYCKEEAKKMFNHFNENKLSSKITKYKKKIIIDMLNMLEKHDTSTNYSQSSNSIWSSLPVTLENQLIQPALAAYKIELEQNNERYNKSDDTAKEKLLQLKLLKEKSFEEQVESIIHSILAWFFKQYGTTAHLGSNTVRSGRASVVKRYEELSKITSRAVHSIVDITTHHGKKTNIINNNDNKNNNKSNEKPTTDINYVEENKKKSSLLVRQMDVLNSTLEKNKEKRRSSIIMVRKRRQSIVIKKRDDIIQRKEARVARINFEMDQALKERRSRMWSSMLCTINFWNLATSKFIFLRERKLATIKLQGMFRKTLFKTKGPATLRTMILAKRSLIPKLIRARKRIAQRSANQIICFLKDLGELGQVRFAIRKFNKQNILTQKLFRSYAIITKCRLDSLIMIFKNYEKRRFLLKLEEAKQMKNIKKGRLTTAKNVAKVANENDTLKKEKIMHRHHGRKRLARKFVDTDPRLLKRIEKHVHAMAEAEEIHKEVLATSIPRIPNHIRKQILLKYIHDRRKEHVKLSYDELNCGQLKSQPKNEDDIFTKLNMLEFVRSDLDSHPLISTMGKKTSTEIKPLHLFTGNQYNHITYRRRADNDMFDLIEQGIIMANKWAKEQKLKKNDDGNRKLKTVQNSEVKELMRRSSLVGTSNIHMRADYLKALLEENMGEFR